MAHFWRKQLQRIINPNWEGGRGHIYLLLSENDDFLGRDGILRERCEHARGRNLEIAEGFVEVPGNM